MVSKFKKVIVTLTLMLVSVSIGGILYVADQQRTQDKTTPSVNNVSRGSQFANNLSDEKIVERESINYRYPSARGDVFVNYEDRLTLNDIPVRIFDGDLTATYKSYFEGNVQRADHVIFKLADKNAAFSSFYSMELGPSGNWKSIQAHIGCFTQDGCSIPNALVFLLESETVFAIVNDDDLLLEILQTSGCNARNSVVGNPESEEDQYQYQVKCINGYFLSKENQQKLRGYTIEQIKAIKIE